jgi:2-dehydropantoate 2-reductase
MRVLVGGAGALGGYFGGCLLNAGRMSPSSLAGNARRNWTGGRGTANDRSASFIHGPIRTVLAGSINETFDLVLLAVKAYGLDGAMRDMEPAISPATVILRC